MTYGIAGTRVRRVPPKFKCPLRPRLPVEGSSAHWRMPWSTLTLSRLTSSIRAKAARPSRPEANESVSKRPFLGCRDVRRDGQRIVEFRMFPTLSELQATCNAAQSQETTKRRALRFLGRRGHVPHFRRGQLLCEQLVVSVDRLMNFLASEAFLMTERHLQPQGQTHGRRRLNQRRRSENGTRPSVN